MNNSSRDGEKGGLGNNYTLIALLLLCCLLAWGPDLGELKKKLIEAASLISLGIVVVKMVKVELE